MAVVVVSSGNFLGARDKEKKEKKLNRQIHKIYIDI